MLDSCKIASMASLFMIRGGMSIPYANLTNRERLIIYALLMTG